MSGEELRPGWVVHTYYVLKLWTNFQHEIREIPEKNKSFFVFTTAGKSSTRKMLLGGSLGLLRKR